MFHRIEFLSRAEVGINSILRLSWIIVVQESLLSPGRSGRRRVLQTAIQFLEENGFLSCCSIDPRSSVDDTPDSGQVRLSIRRAGRRFDLCYLLADGNL